MASRKTRDQGKTSFVKEFLNDHPQANPRAVNQAWKEAGMEGSISDTLVNKQRAALGLTGNIRGKRKPKRQATAFRGRSTSEPTRGRPTGRSTRLAEIEAELDRLLYRVMNAGNLADVEEALRLARRRLYAAFNNHFG